MFREAANLPPFKWAGGDVGRRHRFGGEPSFLQRARFPICSCGKQTYQGLGHPKPEEEGSARGAFRQWLGQVGSRADDGARFEAGAHKRWTPAKGRLAAAELD